MKKNFLFLMFLISLLASSCSDHSSSNDLEFEGLDFNSLCGWCVLGENLYFDGASNSVIYQVVDPCDLSNPILTVERALTVEEIDVLNETFDQSELLDIAIAECGVCYDGCEEIINVHEDGEIVHVLQFDSVSYQQLSGIQDLIAELKSIRSSF